MSGEDTPTGKSLVAQILEKLNLPELIAGPAGKAISRLIGGAADIPAALLESFAQQIRDRAASRQLVNKAVAEAAAKLASSNSDVVARAAHSLLAKEFRQQANKEAVAAKTIDLLANKIGPNANAPPTQEEVDEDWLNVFENYAEKATSERLRELWARVLAGEIRKPGEFSLTTLRFIAELDQTIATLFERYADAVILRRFIPIPSALGGRLLDDLTRLQEYGLVSLVGTHYRITLSIPFEGRFIDYPQEHVIRIKATGDQGSITLLCVVLTRVGIELHALLNPPYNQERPKELVTYLDKGSLEEIQLGAVSQVDQTIRFEAKEILWKREIPSGIGS